MTHPPAVVSALAFDCHDPDTLAAFWYELLGGELTVWPQYGVVCLQAPGITIDFTLVPEQKSIKNRLHLDLASPEPPATIERALELGATRLRDDEEFTVLQDPEGNEFCVLYNAASDRPWQPPS